MKKFLNNILLLFTTAAVLVACDKEDFTVLNSNASTTLSLDISEVVLDKDNAGADVLTASWTEPEYGFDAATIYKIIFTASENSTTVAVGSDLSKKFESVQLNKLLLGLGLEGGIPSEISIQVQAVLSESTEFVSNTATFTATIYEDKLDLSTNWGVVGSATINSWDGPDMPFFKTSNPDILIAYVTLADGEMKFRTDNAWDLNYGDDGNDGTLEEGGANIPVSAGTYKITFNTSTLTYTVEAFTWGLVGDATTNSWDGPDMPLTYDSFSDTWRAIVSLGDGEFKFRFNNDWGLNYGDNGADGILENGGDNISITAGNYLVTFDVNNLEYTVEPTDIWGLVGSAAPNGWDGPNERFTLDFSKDDVWVLYGVTLLDGEIKFRTNDSWDVNYGDTGNDGTLELGGDNIPVSAGTYDIVLDFSDANNFVYTITGS
jgi:starch-binding outer membrane protein SusE/F